MRPTTSGVLGVQPRLESWNSRDHPDQVALRAYLDRVEAVIGTTLVLDDISVALSIGLPPTAPIAGGGRDIDNYLLPIVRRLGMNRCVSAHGEKRHRPTSAIGVALPEGG